jgi:hypothetical protein
MAVVADLVASGEVGCLWRPRPACREFTNAILYVFCACCTMCSMRREFSIESGVYGLLVMT